MRAMRRQLWSALTDKEHKVTLVHSKHHGWLAIGLTAFALGTVRLRRRLRRRIARFMIFSGVTHFRRSARR